MSLKRQQGKFNTINLNLYRLTEIATNLSHKNEDLKYQIDKIKTMKKSQELEEDNIRLKEELKEINEKLKYTRQRENKLMYLFY